MRKPTLVLTLVAAFYVISLSALSADEVEQPVLLESKRIWDRAPHNAFTDLLRHNGRWYCVFREGTKHVSPDGALRVITSTDGVAWESIALITSPKYDLRDAKITVTPDGRLMLNGAGMIADADVRYYSMVWFSDDDGHTWDAGRQIGDDGFWLWRTQWHNGTAYSMGYSTERDRDIRRLRLYKSVDGAIFKTHVASVGAPAGCGEDRILFMKDQSALCLLRHETGDKMGQLGTSAPPYNEWKWRDLNLRIGGPNMLQLPDGRIIAATRLHDNGTRTSLSWVNPSNATLTEVLRLPSGGDTSYAGMVLHNGLLWVSYYSSHEEKASIYLAKVKLPLKPHADAVANTHSPDEVDKPELVPFVVPDKHTLPGVVLDETDATLVGTWQYSTHTPPYVGLGYLHDQKSGKGESSVTYTPDLPAAGTYEVRMSHCYNVRRSTNTPVIVHHADGETTVRIDQQQIPEHDKLFRTLGTFRFEAGKSGWVKIATDGTDGKYVIADAVQFLPQATSAAKNAR
ncbi:MAG: hypothetical protein R3C53_00775 [Pirellulaceae bacterium]